MAETGRPTKYDPDFARQASVFCEKGATDDELAELFDVHRATIYRWKLEHPEFCDAIKTAKEIADERVERALYQKATGFYYTEQQAVKLKRGQYEEEVEVVDVEKYQTPDTVAQIFWMKNRRPDSWRDKQEVSHSGDMDLRFKIYEGVDIEKV